VPAGPRLRTRKTTVVVDYTHHVDYTMNVAERNRVLTLRLSDEEHRRFDAVAKDMGLDVSAMIRALVREREKKGENAKTKK